MKKAGLRIILALVIALTLVIGSVSTVSAAPPVKGATSTAWMNPTSYSFDLNVDFPDNAYSDNGSEAIFLPTDPAWVTYKGFGFNVPANAVITGIQVEYKAYATASTLLNLQLKYSENSTMPPILKLFQLAQTHQAIVICHQ